MGINTFTLSSVIFFGIACFVIAVPLKNRRDYWYALIGVSLLFPFEWFAAHYYNLMVYNTDYVMAFGRIPLFMVLAFGWFWGFPIVICMLFDKKLSSWPRWKSFLILWLAFWVWDFVTEYSACGKGGWFYYWPHGEGWYINDLLPWLIPTTVSLINVVLYYSHRFLLTFSTGKSWIKGFLIHWFGYYVTLATMMFTLFMIFRGLLGVDPIENYFDTIKWF